MDRRLVAGTLLLGLLAAASASAQFNAGDLIYIPVASYSPGAVGSQWRTDLYITNVEDVDIDVAIAYLPSGLFNNAGVFVSRDGWLGGRSADEFGTVDESLAGIPPNGSVVIRNIVGQYWADTLGNDGNGALVIAVYEADTLEPDGTRVYKNAIANARIYNESTIWVEDPDNPGDFVEEPAQYGQVMPGVPWYNMADGGAVGDTYDLSFQTLTGGEESNGRRYNVGVLNASDALTTLTVRIQPYQPDGQPFLDADGNEIFTVLTMPPASQMQLFRPFPNDWEIDAVEGATVSVSIEAWNSLAPEPIPLMTSYGSVIYNSTNDPSTVLPSFNYTYDIDCVWGDNGGAITKGRRTGRRPVEIPSIRE